jgi:hypothetical protein
VHEDCSLQGRRPRKAELAVRPRGSAPNSGGVALVVAGRNVLRRFLPPPQRGDQKAVFTWLGTGQLVRRHELSAPQVSGAGAQVSR